MAAESRQWTRCLFNLPNLSYGDVETFVKQQSKTITKTLQRAHKFFLEEFIHKYEGMCEYYIVGFTYWYCKYENAVSVKAFNQF